MYCFDEFHFTTRQKILSKDQANHAMNILGHTLNRLLQMYDMYLKNPHANA